ncbi:hypothetical protein [Pseudomonas sp. H9]|uniref:hypothetical protein n=1 Tax=Pseudomonas sp. H9 TaxID=483968 RepID=UPI001058334D|nr:hypothetical protein [Pseudomonas sp. H9]TDF86280.1 hypothetical protein E1573_01545 [Pseudomonas sp. H9]
MGLWETVSAFGSRIAVTKTRVASFAGLAIWIVFLRYAEPSVSLVMYSVPFAIALIAMGPLELIPDDWRRLNYFVNALATGFFFVSIMFAVVAIAFELPLSKDEGSIFCLVSWALQLIAFHRALPWIKRSPFHRLSEIRSGYSPPEDQQKAK